MITAIVLTKNEEKNIEECIKSLAWCEEIIVVDDNSTDATPAIAKKLGAEVLTHSLDDNFAAQRNFGLSKANGDWVLFVDGDERVSPALAREISSAVADQISNEINGFYVKRHDIIWGKELKHGDIKNFKEIRLARRDAGKWTRKVHEQWEITGEVGSLKNPLIHFAHPNLNLFTSRIDFYSTLHAKQKFEDGENSSVLKIILWPKFKFIKNYFINFGFLDGTPGLVLAIMMSFHSFLAWSKLWLMQNKVTGNK